MALTLGEGRADPFLVTAIRMGLAGLLALASLAVMRRLDRSLLASRWVWLLGLLNAAGFALQHAGVALNASSGKTALLVNTNLVIVAALSVPLFGERFGARKAVAVTAALAGLVALTTGLDPAFFSGQGFLGDLLVLGASAVWAFFVLGTKRAVREIPARELTPASLAVTGALFGLLLPALAAVAAPPPLPAAAIPLLLYLGLVVTLPPLFLWAYAMERLPATVVTVLTLGEILVAAALGVLLLGESMTGVQLGGAALLLAGILTAAVPETPSAVSRTAPTPRGPGP
jgi:drug/metabolite transporter (DMT)-like permease